MNRNDLDNYITGHGGEDQLTVYCEQCGNKIKGETTRQIELPSASHEFCSLKCMSIWAKDNL